MAWVTQEPDRLFWEVTKHAHIVEVERQKERFINESRVNIVPRKVEDHTIAALGKRTAAVRTILDMDEPDYRKYRKYRRVTQSSFLGAGVARFQGRMEDVCRTWVNRMRERGGECDFAADIANFVPLAVIMSILGLPEDDTPFVLRSTQQLFGASDMNMQGDIGDYRVTVFTELMAYLGRLVESRRKNPTQDLASVIANGVVDGAPMAMLESFSYMMIATTRPSGHPRRAQRAPGWHAVLRRPGLSRKRPVARLPGQPGAAVADPGQPVEASDPGAGRATQAGRHCGSQRRPACRARH